MLPGVFSTLELHHNLEIEMEGSSRIFPTSLPPLARDPPALPPHDIGDGGEEEQVLVPNIGNAPQEPIEAGLVVEHRPTSQANGTRIGEASHPGPLTCNRCQEKTNNNTCDICKTRGLCDKCEEKREYCTTCAPIFASYENVPFRDCISCKSSTQHWCSNCEKDGKEYFLGVQMGRPYCHRCSLNHPYCPVCSPEPTRLLNPS